jgi:hypothetical protein
VAGRSLQRRLLLSALVFAAFALTLAFLYWREGLWQPAAAPAARAVPPLPATSRTTPAAGVAPEPEAAAPAAAADPPPAQSEPPAAPEADAGETRRERGGRGSRTR